jgi:hypothetical protein
MYLILWSLGLFAIWLHFMSKDEVYRLTWLLCGSMALIEGYLLSPPLIQLISLIFILFSGSIYFFPIKKF